MLSMNCVLSALHVIVCLEAATTKAAEEEAAKMAAEAAMKAKGVMEKVVESWCALSLCV